MLKNILNQRGFNLAGLMIAASIIGTVATLAAAQFNDIMVLARDAQRQANIRQVQTALNLYYLDHDQYPAAPDGQTRAENWQVIKQALEKSGPPYMTEVPLDPLNNDSYHFQYWSDGQTFKLTYDTENLNDESPLIAWGY